MQRTDFAEMACSIARTLDVIGEPWSPLILRDVYVGFTRFDQLQADLGISRKVLTERLKWLVRSGVLERRAYSERPPRHEYRLTTKGRDLQIALAGLRQWGDAYLSDKPPRLLRRKGDRKPVVAAFVPKSAAVLRADQIESVPGPGSTL